MLRATSKRLRSYSWRLRTPTTSSKKPQELTPVEKAFVAGACIAGKLPPSSVIQYLSKPRTPRSISHICLKVKARAEELSCPIGDPRCFDTETKRGRKSILTEAQREQVITLVISDPKNRKMAASQVVDEIEASGLPRISPSTLENIMYDAGFSRGQRGWRLQYIPEATQAQRDQVIDLLTSDQHKTKSAQRLVDDGEIKAAGLPRFSPLLLENIMYKAGYTQGHGGWELAYTPKK